MTPLTPRTGEFFRYFAGAYPGRTILMVVLLIMGGLLEGVSVVTLVPLLELAAGPGGGESASGVSQWVGGALSAIGVEPTLGALVALVVVGITLKAFLLWLGMRQVGFTVARVTLDLRLQLVRALLRARWGYYGGQPLGAFANSISSEAIRSSSAYREGCVVLAGLVQVAMYLVIAAIISWQVSLAALITGFVLLTGLRRFITMGRTSGQEQTTLNRNLAARLVDALQGIKPMKAMAREDLFWPLLEGEAEELNQAQRRMVIAGESLRLFQEPAVTLVLGAGLAMLLTFTETTFSSVVVLAFVFYRLMTHVNTLQMRYQVMGVGESAFWSLRNQIREAEDAEERHPGTIQPQGLGEAVELRDVTFMYGEMKVLDGLSVRIPAGGMTALIGQSGSGKTTILDLITGLRRPDSGEVYIDGMPLADLDLMAWRRLIGYVPQEVFLFHDTVRRNVTLGDDSISDDRVIQAIKDAGAWEFIARDPQGIHALLAPQGSTLSGGQRQRLAIARALVKQPALMVLDEATTGLDTRTEAAILETLAGLRGRVTILAVSHQPALRDAADSTIELVNGRIVDDHAVPPSITR
jgi:ATP-binding cassette, subfamily C, bacterial